MNLNITEKKEEKMLARTQVHANIEFEKQTPSYTEVSAALAHNLKADEKLIVIRHVYTVYGNKKAKVIAYVYHDEAKKAFFEPKVKEKKAAVATK